MNVPCCYLFTLLLTHNGSDTTQRMASCCVRCGTTAVPIVQRHMFDYVTHLVGGSSVQGCRVDLTLCV